MKNGALRTEVYALFILHSSFIIFYANEHSAERMRLQRIEYKD